MDNNSLIPDVGYDKYATDGKPFFCPHCKAKSSYSEIVSQETAERIDRTDMIYACKECNELFRMLN